MELLRFCKYFGQFGAVLAIAGLDTIGRFLADCIQVWNRLTIFHADRCGLALVPVAGAALPISLPGARPDHEFDDMRLNLARAALSLLTSLTLTATAIAEEAPRTVGIGDLFTNDALGDGEDRWRSSSYVVSAMRGNAWQGQSPYGFGALVEYRLRGDIIAPENLVSPRADDRPYVGALSVGAHSHMRRGENDLRLGFDLVITGPQTGLGELQDEVHDLLGLPDPLALSGQIANNVHPTVSGEASRSYQIGQAMRVRPFVEAQAGAETLLRVGGDVVVGRFGDGELLLRDNGTGQLYRAIRSSGPGLSWLVGADVATVADSEFLRSADGYTLEDTRTRLRAGLNWQSENATVFYGLTWLSEEFEAQSDPQTVGSLQLRLQF